MIKTITQTNNKALQPDPILNIHEWAKEDFELPPSAGIKGIVDFTLIPYAIPLLIWLSWSNSLKRLDVIKGTQLALTTVMSILICYNIKITPCNILAMFGTDTMARKYVTRNIETAMRMKFMKNIIREKYDKYGNSNKQLKDYDNGTAEFRGGKSEGNWRDFPAKVGTIDDVDTLDKDIGATVDEVGEGSPDMLLTNRTDAQFGIYKLFISGTPKQEHNSNIHEYYKNSNKMLFVMPCIKCGELLHFCNWSDIKFKYDSDYVLDQTELPYIECKLCKTRMYEDDKYKMMNNGFFKATAPQVDPFKNGVMIPSTYSLLGLTWSDMAVQFLNARKKQKQGDHSAMITFFNTKLALAWKTKTGITINYSELYKSREDYTEIPKEVLILTVGADVQASDCIVYTVIGYTENSHRYFFEHIIIGGDTSIPYTDDGSPYKVFKEHMKKTYKNEYGNEQPIISIGMDVGYNSKIVSPFITYMLEEGFEIYGVFGKANDYKFFTKKISTLNKYDIDIYMLNVNIGKQLTYNQMKQTEGEKYIHFNKHPTFTERFFQQMTVERPVKRRMKNGQIKIEWFKPEHAKNEPFDTTNYSLGAFELIGMNDCEDKEQPDEIDWQYYKNMNELGHDPESSLNSGFRVIDPGVTFD